MPQEVPAEALTALERRVIEVGHRARPDGTFPPSMRPWYGLPDRKRLINSVEIPGGWPAAGWADRLTYLANACVDPARAHELLAMAGRIEEADDGPPPGPLEPRGG